MRQVLRPASVLILAWAWVPLASGQAAVDRVGPPSWWVEPTNQTLMILVEGSGLEGATVRFEGGPVRVDRVEVQPGGQALFVDATIPGGASPAACRLEIMAGDRTIERPWDLVAKPVPKAETVGLDDVIYLIMPDRFADGDPSNNEVGTVGDRLLDRGDVQGYHGGDFAGIRGRLPYLADLGATAIWLTPIYKPADTWFVPPGASGKRFSDFHGYSPVDFYETNPRFGSKAEYKALVDAAHKLGLKVIQDHILGFTGPKHPWVKHPPTPGWFNGPVDHPPSCNFRFDAAADPHALEATRRGLTDGWFAGFLPDLDLRSPRPAAYATQQSLWWATLFEADGIRLDTYPMVPRTFWAEWSQRLQKARPGLFAVGEAWTIDPLDLAFFQGGRVGWDGVDPGVPSVFDFPLYSAINRVFSGQSPASDLAKTLARDGNYPRPDLLGVFLDNHDTPRLAAVPGVTPARLRMAVAFLLTTRGIPQITWGDELAMLGHMDDRRDFPGGFPGDPRGAFEGATQTPEEQAIFRTYRDLLRVRKQTPALRRGTLTHLQADATIYVALREFEGQKAVVALNLGPSPASIKLPPGLDGPFDRAFGKGRWAETPEGPRLDLPPDSASIFRTPIPPVPTR